MKKLLLASALLLSSLTVHAKPSDPYVTVFPAVETVMPQTLSALGRLEANQSVEITPQVSGRIVQLNLQDGADVKKGDALVTLDPREQKAAVVQAKVALQEAQRKLTSMRTLFKRNAISKDELDAHTAVVDDLAAALQAKQVTLEHYTLKAPFNGTLGFHSISMGAMINASTVLTTLDDLSALKLTFELPENVLSQVVNGAKISATSDTWPGVTFNGNINSISPRINPNTLTFAVRAQLDNAERKLRPGMLMKIDIERPVMKAMVVPARAVVFDGNQRFVYVIDNNRQVRKRQITTGETLGDFIQVHQGLAPGEQVVDEGVVKVSDGRKVNFRPSTLRVNAPQAGAVAG